MHLHTWKMTSYIGNFRMRKKKNFSDFEHDMVGCSYFTNCGFTGFSSLSFTRDGPKKQKKNSVSSTGVKQNVLLMSEDRLAGDHRKSTDCRNELVSPRPPQASNWIKPFVWNCLQICPPTLLWQKCGCTHSTETVPRVYSCPVFTKFHWWVRLSSHECGRCPARRSFFPAAQQNLCIQPCGKRQPASSLSWQPDNAASHTSFDWVWLRRWHFLSPTPLPHQLRLVPQLSDALPQRDFEAALCFCQCVKVLTHVNEQFLIFFICVTIVTQIFVPAWGCIYNCPLKAT